MSTDTHAHGHNHGDSHGHGVDFASKNREHFDRTAAEYDTIPGALEVGANIGRGIRDHFAFDPETTRVLEFASGTGLISRELTAHSKSILGVDISQGMVEYYNKRFADLGFPTEKVHSIAAELDSDTPGSIPTELKDQKFDLVFCSMAYHHFPDIDAKTRLLASFLAPGGTLLVVDIVKSAKTAAEAERAFARGLPSATKPHDAGAHPHGHTHHATTEVGASDPTLHSSEKPHHLNGVAHVGGIFEEDIKAAFATAAADSGLDMDTYEYKPFTTAKIWDMELPIFLAKVTKKPE